MSQFLQLHLLTAYPPANLNRDDVGRPKTAVVGGVTRLRVSSQSLKRAWRTSSLFRDALAGAMGTRTKQAGKEVLETLLASGVEQAQAQKIVEQVASQLGKVEESGTTGQLVHLGPEELEGIRQLARRLATERRGPTEEELKLFRDKPHAADIALFGRMVADATQFNIEAACQVAHAVTVHKAEVEDDFFTAVDDLNDPHQPDSDRGAGHMGETGFGAGLFYLYFCLNWDLLLENLDGDAETAEVAVRVLTEAACKVAPTGKQNSFASRAYASYGLAERGTEQPRSLVAAFLRPVTGSDPLGDAVAALEGTCSRFDAVYGQGDVERYSFSAVDGRGNLAELQAFLVGGRRA